MILLNGTPDDAEWMHVGVTGVLQAGTIVEVDEARGNHICNKFGRKGIVQMIYGDKKEDQTVTSMALWQEFWEDQITRFNQHNEDQKEKGSRYAKPTAELKEHAKKLDFELLQPWQIKTTENQELKDLRKSKEEQAASLKILSEQVATLTELLETSMQQKGQTKKGR